MASGGAARTMKSGEGAALNGWRSLFVAKVGVITLAVALVVGALASSRRGAQAPSAQPPVPEWQIAAGGKVSFDVASVKQNKSGGRLSSNVSLAPGDGLPTPLSGGLFSATNYQLVFYVAFAYNLTVDQTTRLASQLPPWAGGRFDIEARAEGNPTRDQMRLMMQSLLADRFKLVVHHETKQGPIYALVLARPGKTGPQLQPHVDDGSCSGASTAPGAVTPKPASSSADGPPVCSVGLIYRPPSSPGRERAGARNVTIDQLANLITIIGAKGGPRLDGPVVDRTGLGGTFDFTIEFAPQVDEPLPAGSDFQPDPSGPTFLEALQEQLGLKLESQAGPIDILVIDHVEQPSEN
jgi:uncharacterized protein (TIGR03435 family)